nr:uncharacterized mitochondrial protein AtMg00810-like [Tanacetum cinerariifolium]
MAFISLASTSSGKGEVNTASIPTAKTQVSPASANIAVASINHDTIDEDDIKEMDIKWNMALLRWDWSYMANKEENHAFVANEEALTKFVLMAKSSSSSKYEVFVNSLYSKSCKKNTDSLNTKITNLTEALSDSKTNLYHYKLGLSQVEARLVEFKTQEIKFYEKIRGLEFDLKNNNIKIENLMNELEQIKKEKEGPSPSIESNYSDLQNSNSSVSEHGESSESITSKPMIEFIKAADRPTDIKTNKVEAARKPSVKYAEMYRNTHKSPKGNSQNIIDDKGYWDSGCSRHMTGNISYLSDYEPYDGGYVSFGQGGGKITRKHKASCKTKLVNLVSKPIHTLHMDLFGPTSVSSLNHKWYCLVVTDDFSREMNEFCTRKGIKREFSNARTPQQNGVAERRNRSLIEAARTMLADVKLPVTFWAEAVNTACYVQNRVLRTKRVEENLHADFLENKLIEKGAGSNWLFDIDTLTKSMNYVPVVVAGTSSTNFSGTKDAASQDVKKDVSSLRYITLPNWFHEAHLESSTSNAQDACNADAPESSGNSNPTATLTNPPADQIEILIVESAIPTVSSPVLTACLDDSLEPLSTIRLISKKVLKNKKDERGIVIRNKARLVAQGDTQEEGSNYEEVFASVARIEAIRLFLAYASFMGFTVYQMDVKSTFLYGTINEEVYLCREFEALMYEKFQMSAMGELNFFLGLQVLQKKDGIFLSQDKYVGDILKKFGYSYVKSANTSMDKENPWGKDGPGKDVELHLYRSMIRSLMYLTASKPDIMVVVCACARNQVKPKECHMHAVKRIFRYLKGHPKLGLWYPKESPFDLVAHLDSDYGCATQYRKSTTEGCQFLGRRLILWQCKKQTIMASSTTEAEYVAAASGCGQVL